MSHPGLRLVVAILLSLPFSSALADELDAIRAQCLQEAVLGGIGADEQPDFIQLCVNAYLRQQGREPLSVLPADTTVANPGN